MKADTLRRYTSLHTWTGITTGILLFVAFYAGALSVYKAEIREWADPRSHATERAIAAGDTFTPDALVEAFVNGPHARPDFFVMPSGYFQSFPGHGRYELLFIERDESGERVFWRVHEPGGEPVPSTDGRLSQADNFIEELHFTMGLPVEIGTWLYGLVTLLYGVAIISGLVIHWPHLVRDLFTIRRGRNLKRYWQDAHNVVGVISLPFHLMFVFTSFLLCISTVAIVGLNLFTLGNQLELENAQKLFQIAPPHEDSDTPAAMLSVAQLLARAHAFEPRLTVNSLGWHDYGTETATVDLRGPYDRSLIGFSTINLDAATGALRGADLPGAHNPSLALASLVVTLHYGRFGEGWGRDVVRFSFLALGLLGAFLFYSGNLLWIESRRKRKSPSQPKHHYALARLTLAGTLGTVLGISALLLFEKLLPTDSLLRAEWSPNIWYLTLAASAVWVLIRPVWRAGVELLWACALLTAALPIANALLYMPPWHSVSRVPGVFAIDLIALALAVGFAVMARATARRARAGDPHSVWARPSVARAEATQSAPSP